MQGGTPPRAGGTLAEVIVAMTLSVIVLGTATTSLLRQHRAAASLGATARSGAQLRAATGAIGAELSLLAIASGDLVPGELRDTALELRGFVGAGLACDSDAGGAVLAVEPVSAPAVAAKAGDSLWWYTGVSGQEWRGALITASDSAVAPCPLAGGAVTRAVRLSISALDSIPLGAPLRVTRKVRYSLYRGGDGSWQLGYREWNEPAGKLAPPQPVAGPFIRRAGAERSGFRYFDGNGAELSTGGPGADAARVARIRLTFLTAERVAVPGSDSLRRDSLDLALERMRLP